MPRIDPDKVKGITKRGYDARNMLYLPFDKDPLNMGSKSRTLGLTLPPGRTWESMKDDPEYGKAVTAISDFIDENFTGTDREHMQSNAQYINAATLVLDEEGPEGVKNPLNKLEVEAHEVTHKVLNEDLIGMGFSHEENEMIVRLNDIRHGSPETKRRSLAFAKKAGFDQDVLEEEFGDILNRVEKVSSLINEQRRRETELKTAEGEKDKSAIDSFTDMMKDLNSLIGIGKKKEGKEGED